jgi:hypothetical protein
MRKEKTRIAEPTLKRGTVDVGIGVGSLVLATVSYHGDAA